jgi:hypothetical protein
LPSLPAIHGQYDGVPVKSVQPSSEKADKSRKTNKLVEHRQNQANCSKKFTMEDERDAPYALIHAAPGLSGLEQSFHIGHPLSNSLVDWEHDG